MSPEDHAAKIMGATPLTPTVAMKNWNEKKRRWDGVICQAFRYPDGSEGIVVYDVGTAKTESELDVWAEGALEARAWEAKEPTRQ